MQIAENSAYDVPNGSLRADGDDDYTRSGRRGSGVAWYLSGMVTSVYDPPAACLAPAAAKRTTRKATMPMRLPLFLDSPSSACTPSFNVRIGPDRTYVDSKSCN